MNLTFLGRFGHPGFEIGTGSVFLQLKLADEINNPFEGT